MATMTFYSVAGANSPVDGYAEVSSANSPLSTLRSATGTSADDTSYPLTPFLQASTTTNQFAALSRAIFCFNTAALSGYTITGATISLYANASPRNDLGAADLHIASATPASTAAIVPSDYSNVGTTSFGSISNGSITTGYITITLNSSGLSNINKTGVSSFSAQTSWDINNSFTGTWVSSGLSAIYLYSADSGNPPTLTVTYQVPPTLTGISSITGLSSITF